MISVVIPSYNRKDSMLTLLHDVFRQDHPNFEVIVVDDCSSDGSPDAIAETFPQVNLQINANNSGPSVTRNNGIRMAKGDIIVGFDSDVTVPDTRCLSKVDETFQAPNAPHALAFRLLQPDGVTDDIARWWHPVPAARYATQPFDTDYFSGTGYAFRRDAIIRAELFPEFLYMHYEEVFLALKAIDNGFIVRYSPEIQVIHHEGQVSRRSEIKMFYKHRNQLLLAYLLYPLPKALAYALPRTVKAGIQSVLGGYFKNYLRSLGSATQVIRKHNLIRRPVHPETLKKMKSFRTAAVAGGNILANVNQSENRLASP